MLVVTDRAKYRRGPISLDRLELPHSLGVPDQEKIGGAAARTEKVLPGGLIGVGNARIPDRRHHVEVGGRQNGAAVAVGRGVDGSGESSAPDERRADEVSGLVKALGPVNIRSDVPPRDDKAAVRKGRHVADVLPALLIEDVDEDVALDE